jgi:hypothetical protein
MSGASGEMDSRSPRGTVDAQLDVHRATTRSVHFLFNQLCNPSPGRTVPMKDLVFVVVTAAFFAAGWLYAKSFDRL